MPLDKEPTRRSTGGELQTIVEDRPELRNIAAGLEERKDRAGRAG
jgi:hypothetical protein